MKRKLSKSHKKAISEAQKRRWRKYRRAMRTK